MPGKSFLEIFEVWPIGAEKSHGKLFLKPKTGSGVLYLRANHQQFSFTSIKRQKLTQKICKFNRKATIMKVTKWDIKI